MDDPVRINNILAYALTMGLEVQFDMSDMYRVTHKQHNYQVMFIYGLRSLESFLRGYQFAVTTNITEGYEGGPYKWMEEHSVESP